MPLAGARPVTTRAEVDAAGVDPHQVLVWKGDQGRPFIIAGLLEQEALGALSRRAWLYILSGGGLMAGTLLVSIWKLTDVIR